LIVFDSRRRRIMSMLILLAFESNMTTFLPEV
jgi:hypothetical protein